MNLATPTYICLDVPDPQASAVMTVRRQYCERLREFPVEITVTGSSGVGAIRAQLEWADVERKLRAFCARTPPIEAELGGVVRFPNTDIFSLAMCDPMPFEALHAGLKASGLRFEDSRFPFFPHCTLRMEGPLTDADVSALFGVRVPGRFTLRVMALYQRAGDGPISAVWRCPLTG